MLAKYWEWGFPECDFEISSILRNGMADSDSMSSSGSKCPYRHGVLSCENHRGGSWKSMQQMVTDRSVLSEEGLSISIGPHCGLGCRQHYREQVKTMTVLCKVHSK